MRAKLFLGLAGAVMIGLGGLAGCEREVAREERVIERNGEVVEREEERQIDTNGGYRIEREEEVQPGAPGTPAD